MNLADLDQAVVDHLDGVTVAGWPRPFALADVPKEAGWQGEPGSSPFQPYGRVDPNPVNRRALTLDAHRRHVGEWVVKGVALTAHEAKAITDAARPRLLDTPLTGVPAGMAITRVRHVSTTGPYPDHDVVPELYVSACTVELTIDKE